MASSRVFLPAVVADPLIRFFANAWNPPGAHLKGAFHDRPSTPRARRHAGAAALPAYPAGVCEQHLPVRSVLRAIARRPGSPGDPSWSRSVCRCRRRRRRSMRCGHGLSRVMLRRRSASGSCIATAKTSRRTTCWRTCGSTSQPHERRPVGCGNSPSGISSDLKAT